MSFFSWLLLIFGAAGRSVFVDKFRGATPQPADPFAIQFISDTFVFAFFLCSLLVYIAAARPDLHYLCHQRGVACIVLAGVGSSLAMFLQAYSSSHVDPALRHISTLVLVVLTSAIAYFAGAGPGNGACNALHLPVFAFCIGGVLLAGAGSLSRVPNTMSSSDDKSWFSIYILSYAPQAGALVATTYYFKRYLIFREQDVRNMHATNGLFVAIETSRSDLATAEDDNDDRFDFKAQQRTDPLTGKVLFAFCMVFVQLLFTLLLGPVDIAPFIGSSQNVTHGLDRFRDAFTCVFQPANSETAACTTAYQPFLFYTSSTCAFVVGSMFALQRTPFGAAQAIVMGATSLGEFLRSTFPNELADPGAKVGSTSVGESVGAVALSLTAVILTFVAEESSQLETVPRSRRAALNGSESSAAVPGSSSKSGAGTTERDKLVDYYGNEYSGGAGGVGY